MKKMRIFLVFILVVAISSGFGVSKKEFSEKDYINPKRVTELGLLLKRMLDVYHYKKMKYDDDFSQKVFQQYLKKIDYGKQFLLKSHVDELAKYKLEMDDQFLTGKISIIDMTDKIFKERIKKVESLRSFFFSKKYKFSFDKDEYIESDADKREFMTTEEEFKNYWEKSFKQAVIVRYLTFLQEQKDSLDEAKDKTKNKDKKKKKNKVKQPILSEAALMEKAKKTVGKKYEKLLVRLLEDDRGTHLENFYNSVANIFDPHTDYMPPKRKDDFDIDISGSLQGIGAVLTEDDSYIKVVEIIPGGPAWKGRELEAEDKILGVTQGEGELIDLIDMRVDEAVTHIRGKKGTVVKLTVKKTDNSIKVISITRDIVQVAASFAKASVLHHKKLGVKVGYIRLPKFYRDFSDGVRTCTEDVKNELLSLKKKGLNGVILDLRNNGGGALEDARTIAGLFIKSGPIVQVRDMEGNVEIYQDTDNVVHYDGPLIVMTNHFSASASEIVAAAMQDYQRGLIVGGADTHGKGTVQAVIDLNRYRTTEFPDPPPGALKITTQKFYRVTGGSTQFKGVTPDLILPDQFSYVKNREMDVENALPWDEIKGNKIELWTKHKIDYEQLKKKSLARLKTNESLKKIEKSIEYLTQRRDDTNFPLKLSKVIEQDEMNKKVADELKDDKPNLDLEVTDFEESQTEVVKQLKNAKEKKQWKEDFDERNKEWIEELQKDGVLIETVNIMKDMIDNN
ncbi:MAG: hypothetical protein A2202_01735 [Bdellovibrionales bacterium RIFOXYA1_FULL_36_14]|nr:MAG: hypothetical protein A2202_01735 [Bdellovibrionales bacterium RIFOXYA1_FULL_36_14]